MAQIIKQIKGYQVVRYPGDPYVTAVIALFCEDLYRLVLALLKEPDPEAINQYDPNNLLGVAYLDGRDQYEHYIDLLRNEGPLFAYFFIDETPPEKPPLFAILTGEEMGEGEAEPISEGEIASTLEEIKNLLNR
jgi:hypothetical protein